MLYTAGIPDVNWKFFENWDISKVFPLFPELSKRDLIQSHMDTTKELDKVHEIMMMKAMTTQKIMVEEAEK